MNLVAYLRVSTDKQAEEGLGLDVQRAGIRTWAKANGHRIAGWAADEGVSGSNGVETRVGLSDALRALETGAARGLVVYRLDRLSRTLTVQEATLLTVWQMGCTVFAVDLGEIPADDPDDPMRTALRQMVGVFGQLERGLINARLRAGRKLKAERGGFAYGSPPYGWKSEAGELVPVDSEQQVIAEVRHLAAAGFSQHRIADELNAAGHRTKRGAIWTQVAVRRVLNRTP